MFQSKQPKSMRGLRHAMYITVACNCDMPDRVYACQFMQDNMQQPCIIAEQAIPLSCYCLVVMDE